MSCPQMHRRAGAGAGTGRSEQGWARWGPRPQAPPTPGALRKRRAPLTPPTPGGKGTGAREGEGKWVRQETWGDNKLLFPLEPEAGRTGERTKCFVGREAGPCGESSDLRCWETMTVITDCIYITLYD